MNKAYEKSQCPSAKGIGVFDKVDVVQTEQKNVKLTWKPRSEKQLGVVAKQDKNTLIYRFQ